MRLRLKNERGQWIARKAAPKRIAATLRGSIEKPTKPFLLVFACSPSFFECRHPAFLFLVGFQCRQQFDELFNQVPSGWESSIQAKCYLNFLEYR